MIALAVAAYRRNNLIPFAAILFLFPYILVSNLLLPIGTIMGERLMYLPVAGFALGTSLFLTPHLRKRNVWIICALAVVMLLYSARTVTRNSIWHDNELLYGTDVKTVPHNTKLLTNHAIILKSQRRIQEAEGELQKAIDLGTPWGVTYLEMSSVRIIQGRFREAFDALRKADELGGREQPILENTAIAQFLSGDTVAAYGTLHIADSKGISLNPALRKKILDAMDAK